jgi:hypothetical protein
VLLDFQQLRAASDSHTEPESILTMKLRRGLLNCMCLCKITMQLVRIVHADRNCLKGGYWRGQHLQSIPECLGDYILIDDAIFLHTSELEWHQTVVVRTPFLHHGFFGSLQEISMVVFRGSPHTTLQGIESCKHTCRRLHRPLKNCVATLQQFYEDCEGREASLARHLQLSFAASGHPAFTTF